MMNSSSIMTAKAVRNIKKIERPRPLRQDSKKSSSFGDDLINDLETLNVNLSNCQFSDAVFEQLQQACNGLKVYGAQLEAKYKENLDRYFVTFRNASRDDRLDRLSKLRLLEAVELRAMGWKQNDEISKYYQSKFVELENILERGPTPIASSSNGVQQSLSSQNIPASLIPGEIIKNSGKFSKATKIPGKNYFKDEIVIRNSDSGKVMGIKGRRVHMIEELSDTIISFQRVTQGVKERLVQITGPHEDAIGSAKNLIEDTIRRNASPIREKSDTHLLKSMSSNSLDSNASEDSGTSISASHDLNYKSAPIIHSYSTNDASKIRDYQYTVMVGNEAIRLSSSNLDKVRTAKLVLEEYFAGQAESSGYSSCNHSYSDIGNARRPISMYASFGHTSPLPSSRESEELERSNKIEMNGGPLQRCKSIPMTMSNHSGGSQSSTDEETYKADGSTTEDEKFVGSDHPINSDKSFVTACSNHKECINGLYNGTNTLHSASFRRAQFAKSLSEVEKSNCSTVNELKLPSPSSYIISYPRDFLLECAKSPFSTLVPKDLTHLIQDLPYLFKKTADMFDPDTYKEKVFVCVPISKPRETPPRQLSSVNNEFDEES